MLRNLLVLFGLVLGLISTLGCENPVSGAQGAGGSSSTLKGFFIDSPLGGLKYTTSSGKTGTTDKNGTFEYNDGDAVEFNLGTQKLGPAIEASKTITPLSIFGASSLIDGSGAATKAQNLIRLLLALDDGTNTYGLNIPSSAQATINADFSVLLSSASFDSDAKAIVAAVKGVDVSSITLPSAAEAINHWNISKVLVDSINNPSSTGKNLFLTVKIPAGYGGSSIKLAYKADRTLPGMSSYVSGTYLTVPASGDTMTFTASMHAAKWQMTLSLIRDSENVQVDDLLSFFDTNGFQAGLPSAYPLDMLSGEVRNLVTDLSGGLAVKITSVKTVSGKLILPRYLPNGVTDWADIPSRYDEYSLFLDIKDGSNTLASFSVSKNLPSTPFTLNGSNYEIPYSVTLPANFAYRMQLYYRTVYPGGNNVYPSVSIPTLTSDNSNINLTSSVWNVPSS